MALKKISANATEKFENEIGTTMVMVTTKTTKASSVTLHSRVRKGDEEVATISYEKEGGYLLVDIRKFGSLSKEEAQGILSVAASDIIGEVCGSDEEEAAAE